MKVKIAAFDIDGTIFRSSLLIKLIERLVEEKIFPSSALKEVERDYILWLHREGTYESYIQKVINVYDKYIVGKEIKEITRVARLVVKEERKKTYRFTRDLIKELKKENYLLLAISASPHYIVDLFAKSMGFDHSFGHLPEIKKGKITGRNIKDNVFTDKAKVIHEFAEEEGIVIDFKKSVAVGDTGGDISMLEIVGRPIAFNPNKKFADIAIKKGWDIVVERKDVVYGIKKGKLISI